MSQVERRASPALTTTFGFACVIGGVLAVRWFLDEMDGGFGLLYLGTIVAAILASVPSARLDLGARTVGARQLLRELPWLTQIVLTAGFLYLNVRRRVDEVGISDRAAGSGNVNIGAICLGLVMVAPFVWLEVAAIGLRGGRWVARWVAAIGAMVIAGVATYPMSDGFFGQSGSVTHGTILASMISAAALVAGYCVLVLAGVFIRTADADDDVDEALGSDADRA